MKTYIGAWSVAATLVVTNVTSAASSGLDSMAIAVGGQSTCTSSDSGPPPPIGSLIGSLFVIPTPAIGNGISDCGLNGSIKSLTATTGPVTSVNSVSATVGGGLYTGTSGATSNYGTLSLTSHGNNQGKPNLFGFSESGGFSTFNDQLTFISPTQKNGSSGSVIYTFTVSGALTTPVSSSAGGPQNLAKLDVHQSNHILNQVFTASTYPIFGTILGNNSYPGFTMSEGSVSGSGEFSTLRIPFVWGKAENLEVGLSAVSYPTTGETLDTHLKAVLTGIAVFDANGHLDNNYKIDAASGSLYSAGGVLPVPEPEAYALFLAGLLLVGFMTTHRSSFRN